MKRNSLISVLTFAALSAVSSLAWADACLDDARAAAGECKASCREEYQLAKDTCSNRDHVCVESCRADRQVCLQPTLDVLDAAIAVCNADRATAVGICRGLHADGSDELDACIDQAQVVGFVCRKAARKAAKPGVSACRSAFKACVKNTCPQTSIPDPAELRACKDDAVGLYDDCKEACTEARQLAKDTCLNRDHLCVESCRADRGLCRAPHEATRAAAVALCKSARIAAFDNCRLLYGAGTVDRQTCIAQAQVAAFTCRDMAREDVASDLDACGVTFRACAEACPAPGGGS